MRTFYTKAALCYLFLLFSAIGVLQFWYKHLDHITRGHSVPWLEPFLEQMTGNWNACACPVCLFSDPYQLDVGP